MSYAFAEQPPVENVQRGTVFALVAVPVGIIAWVVIWSFGFIASIVGFGVAWLALFLYRFGSGGLISRGGAIRVSIITIGTLLVAIYAGLVADGVAGFSRVRGIGPIETLTSPEFWPVFNAIMADSAVWAEVLPSIGLALLFGALGCFSMLRGAFMMSKAEAEAAAAPPATPLTEPGATGAFEWPQQSPTAGGEPSAATPPAQAPVYGAPTTPPPPMMLNGEPYDPDKR